MDSHNKHARLPGRLVMLGFGSIGQAVVPLLFRHFELEPSQVTVVSRGPDQSGIAEEYGIAYEATPLQEGNLESILDPLLQKGDFLLNLSVDVSSLDLIRYCWRRGILYSTPAPNRGKVFTTTSNCRCRGARITRCARQCWPSASTNATARRPWSRKAPIRAWLPCW
ncbi:saccharopine dehydrogenase NADP-binding domain-containing protein [Duganella sp. Root1480D1]|uniref:saccharopine dehydrogenase NADP-binding domain-containing protein n=1 Tax=Duganella sp. Root1480D1 TaxID=1736471 RepID=UPI001E5BA32F|nr:saccharopine dehydrogenase NADP-binding domain-containing protein [Duganella sp. Root1480D1]